MEQLLTDPWFWVPMAFWAGWKISEHWHLYTFKEVLKDLGVKHQDLQRLREKIEAEPEEAEEDPNRSLPELEVKIEQHPEGLFAYRKADSFFLARGRDREELMENLVANLTNVRVVVAKEDGAELISPKV